MDECQFNDCSHTHDKGCAILPAVDNGTLSISRYQRFLKLKEKM
jgi:ribosome biogenesis GTPase / thiamine phosphate phosphatase